MNGLDFETYSDVDLLKHNLDRYVHGRDFTVLLAGWSPGPGASGLILDFVNRPGDSLNALRDEIESAIEWQSVIVAQNRGFETAVLKHLGLWSDQLNDLMVDSAVVARAEGAQSSLEFASRQLTTMPKLETGKALIKLFSIPNEHNGFKPPTREMTQTFQNDWDLFGEYCLQDAKAGLAIIDRAVTYHSRENDYERLTHEMNVNGWHVDVPLVQLMKQQYEANTQALVESFRSRFDVPDTFFGSSPQQQKWCKERGVTVKSLDSDHVTRLAAALDKEIKSLVPDHPRFQALCEVQLFAQAKQALGGSSLSKLQVILDTVGPDNRLRDQYLHVGAGQTYRTSARGAQLQNLKRLGSDLIDFDDPDFDLFDQDPSNEVMAKNLRQVFVAEHPQGEYIVGDFSSVESRGLAWLAGEDYKIQAYRDGKDIYKVLAAKFQNISYEEVTKEARAEGKYSELSCGYQAGAEAVKNFMHKLGFEVTLEGAEQRVAQWRDANPNIVKLWATLDEVLKEGLATGYCSRDLANNLYVIVKHRSTPLSLSTLHAGAQSLSVALFSHRTGACILTRVFHGCYTRGRSICYYKPTKLVAGPLWKSDFVDKKTKRKAYYSIYGGKLSGILTQSLCRELFFYSLQKFANYKKAGNPTNVKTVGQFHDEIVLEWSPRKESVDWTLEHAVSYLEMAMTKTPPELQGFPLGAEINHAHRYIK